MTEEAGLDLRPDVTVHAHGEGIVHAHPPGDLDQLCINTIRSAIAMPMELEMPWPRGPVVTSTPGVCPYSGCPGVLEPHCRKRFSSSRARS